MRMVKWSIKNDKVYLIEEYAQEEFICDFNKEEVEKLLNQIQNEHQDAVFESSGEDN